MACTSFFSSLLSQLHLRQCHCHHPHAQIFASDMLSPSHEFDADLAAKLQNLHHSERENNASDLLSFTWICQALDVVKSTHTYMTHFANTHIATSVVMTVPLNNMIQHYMKDSVKMLDVCCLLKESLTNTHCYVKAFHKALRRLQNLKLVHRAEIQRARRDLLSVQHVQARMQQGEGEKALQACNSMFRRLSNRLPCPSSQHLNGTAFSPGSDVVSTALYGGQMLVLFFLRLLSGAICPPQKPRKSSSSTAKHHHRQPAWGPYLLALQAQLDKEMSHIQQKKTQKCNTLLPEIQALHVSLHQIWEVLLVPGPITKQAKENVSDLVRSATAFADHAQSSIARLLRQLDCISSSIVDAQMALLVYRK
ncbi:hypothetical protein L7F22_061636 [Adiantum nelumboides]|nr:hypothetical protein [Adiantum nelumboides]